MKEIQCGGVVEWRCVEGSSSLELKVRECPLEEMIFELRSEREGVNRQTRQRKTFVARGRWWRKLWNGKELSVLKNQKEDQNGKIIVSSGENDRNSISLDHVGLVDPGQEFGFCSKWNGTPMKDLKSRDGQLLKPDCDKARILMIQKIWMIRI